jgi:hypothetical protein
MARIAKIGYGESHVVGNYARRLKLSLASGAATDMGKLDKEKAVSRT